MDLWTPPHDAPHLLEWWRPLMLVSRRARLDRFPWPVHLDEFRLAGRVVRKGRPDIWIYEHHENGGSVCVDAAGATYKFTATPRGGGAGRFTTCDVRTALWRARLPEVVAPIRYDERRRRGAAVDEWEGAAADEGGERAGAVGDDPTADGPAVDDVADPAIDDDADGHVDGAETTGGRHAAGDRPDPAGARRSPSRVIQRGHLTLIAG
jgi:hypothetical protein